MLTDIQIEKLNFNTLILKRWAIMGKTACRYVINAVGKGGQTYLTHCQDKHELKKWLADHQDDLVMNELKIINKKKRPFLNIFSLKK